MCNKITKVMLKPQDKFGADVNADVHIKMHV